MEGIGYSISAFYGANSIKITTRVSLFYSQMASNISVSLAVQLKQSVSSQLGWLKITPMFLFPPQFNHGFQSNVNICHF